MNSNLIPGKFIEQQANLLAYKFKSTPAGIAGKISVFSYGVFTALFVCCLTYYFAFVGNALVDFPRFIFDIFIVSYPLILKKFGLNNTGNLSFFLTWYIFVSTIDFVLYQSSSIDPSMPSNIYDVAIIAAAFGGLFMKCNIQHHLDAKVLAQGHLPEIRDNLFKTIFMFSIVSFLCFSLAVANDIWNKTFTYQHDFISVTFIFSWFIYGLVSLLMLCVPRTPTRKAVKNKLSSGLAFKG